MHTSAVLFLSFCIFGCQSAVFRLYTRESGSSSEYVLKKDVNNLKGSTFDGKRKTVMIIHGYSENAKASWVTRMRSALLQQENINVITMDWSDRSGGWYFDITGNARGAGQEAGDLIHFLVTKAPSAQSLVHIVGFSLGAHAAGFCGRYLRTNYNMKPDRITGLDPAGPDFYHKNPDRRLDSSDADFVDVIHTDTDLVGLSHQIGHIDFYPNGGADQAGCSFKLDLVDWLSCDHMRCPEYFIESVAQPSAFPSYPCNNIDDFDRGRCVKCSSGQCPSMGYYADRTRRQASGKHYLYSNKSPPYSANRYYLLTFKTGRKWFSGITSLIKIYVKLTGSNGATGEVQLKRRSVNSGSTESFLVPASRDLGSLVSIQARGAWVDKWYVEHVVAKPVWTSQQYHTACFKVWISSGATEKKFSEGKHSC